MFFSETPFNILERDRSYIHMKQCSLLNNRDHPYDLSHLWTEGVTSCLAVGLRCRQSADSDFKIELYHSVSQHSYYKEEIESWLKTEGYNKTPQPQPFGYFIYQFLQQVTDTTPENFMIVLGNEDDDFYFHRKDVKNIVNACIEHINHHQKDPSKHLKLIDDNNFKAIAKTSSLAITQSGQYGSLSQIFYYSLLTIVDMLTPKFADSPINKAEKKFTDGVVQILKSAKSLVGIVNNDNVDDLHVKLGQQFFSDKWNEIKFVASRYLKDLAFTQESETALLYLKIIAWNPFNNQADEDLLNKWLAKSQYEITPALKDQILKRNDVKLDVGPKSCS